MTLNRGALDRGLRAFVGGPVAIVVVVMLVLSFPAAAGAEITIAGQATGVTVPVGNGGFKFSGTFVDSSGHAGTYHGAYDELTTGYTSCRGVGIGLIYCDNPPYYSGLPYRCNLVRGEVTFRSQGGKEITLLIGSGGFAPPQSRIVSGVCQQQADPTLHDTYLLLLNRTAMWPATTEEFSRGYGLLAEAFGSLVGTSAPRGASPVYFDDFALNLNLFSNP